jgi:hypothetical protein
MANLIEKLGLDWLPILFGRIPFHIEAPDAQSRLSEIRASFSGLEEEKVDEALTYCDGLLKREDERSAKIESKAFTLIGTTGIATAFITGFAALLLDRGKISSLLVLMIGALGYILAVAALIFTVYLAVKVVTVGDYKFTYPSASDILKLATQNLIDVRRERAASLLFSYEQNAITVNYKATYLGGAQLWFRNSIVLLSGLTMVLAIYAPFTSSAPASNVAISTSTPTATATPTVVSSPTATLTATTKPTTTETPTATTMPPTPTSPAAPTATVTAGTPKP